MDYRRSPFERDSFLRRYSAGVAAVAVLFAAVAMLPSSGPDTIESVGNDSRGGTNGSDALGLNVDEPGDDAATAEPSATADPSRSAAATRVGGRLVTPDVAKREGLNVDFGANCDPATGRIKLPSVYAPPCVPPHSGDNGGATYRGVTQDTLRIAVYLPRFNPALEAIVAGTGAGETTDPEKQKQVYRDYADLFASHYETYGRKIEVHFVEGSGNNTDNQAAKADAIKVADEIKAFASIRGPAGALAYVKELAARGVVCVDCNGGLPIEFFQERAPYVWFSGGGWSAGGIHLAEIIGKRLWGRKARWAGSEDLRQRQRSFANVYYETAEKDFKRGADLLDRELAKYGARIDEHVPYPFDLATAQQQARTIIARLKSKGVTTVLLATDWIYPIFFTQEATRQEYEPEWLAAGQTLWTFAARTYDQQQWSRAYGPNTPLLKPELTDAHRLNVWHHGRAPATACCYGPMWMFFTGVHMAGPELTPQTFRDGMFSYPATGGVATGGIVTNQISYGRGLWPFGDDYTGSDDLGDSYWDPRASGPDETGKQGQGMYRVLENGKRRLAGQWPSGEPAYFDPKGTVMLFNEFPPTDRPPSYEHKHHD